MDAGTLIDDLFAVVKKAERDTKRTAAPNGEPHDAARKGDHHALGQ